MEQIKEEIAKIIAKIPSGTIFDAHYVIERIFKSNAKSASLYIKNAGDTISNWHSSLAKDIDKVAKELGCERIGKAYSYNLLGRANKNTAWKKN